jgi:hypothetical protein
MITVKTLKKLTDQLPDDAIIFGYEGEDTGITIKMPDGNYKFIRACDSDEVDTYTEGFDK